MKRIVLAALLTLAFATPAFAFHCPKDMAKIDAKLAENPPLTTEQLAEVQKLRKEGEDYHNAGNHQEAVDTLARAMQILGIQ